MGSFRNRVINGDMRIAQRGTSNVLPSTAAGIYTTVDRWAIYTGTLTSTMTTYQNTLTVSDVPYQQGLRYASNLVVNSAGTSTSFTVWQTIEGYNAQDLNWGTPFGSPVTFSFWVKASITGNYTFHMISAGTDYSYLAPYTVVNPNTWEYKTLTIPPPPNGSTWGTGTNAWGYLQFRFVQPSASSGTIGWQAGVVQKLYGTVNLCDVQGATWAFTGVQLEKGTVATPFDVRPYATELQLCQRYFTRLGGTVGYEYIGTGVAAGSTVTNIFAPTPVPMRDISATSISVSNVAAIRLLGNVSGVWNGTNAVAIVKDGPGTNGLGLSVTVSGGLSLGQAYILQNTNTTAPSLGFIQINNEL